MNSKIVKIGDKIDIRILQQVDQEQKTGQAPKIYKSMVQDIKIDDMMEVSMPTESGKMVLLPTGIRYEFIFYTKNGLYRCIAQVKERYKSNNLFMLLIEPKTSLEKYQRREYYRFECIMDMTYMKLTEAEAQIEDIALLKQMHQKEYPLELPQKAIAVDLSGGGIRFISEKEKEENEYLLINIVLSGENITYALEVAGRVLSCKRVESETKIKKYEYRVQFLIKEPKKREMIIKYIFEQERKNRQKG
ncbi:MAG: flagellar brake domain-containing protein [Lachnospiraceae bacterium]